MNNLSPTLLCNIKVKKKNSNVIINKIIKIINRQAQKVFAVAYMRSNCKALTGKILVFWIAGRLWVVVACEGGSPWTRFDCI